jgi:hypothetical protein
MSKYGGYVPSHVRDSAIAWNIASGPRLAFESKFHAPAHVAAVPDASALDASVYLLDVKDAKPDHYVIPKRGSGVVLLPMEKPFVAQNSYAREFPDYRAEAEALLAIDPAGVEAGFAIADKIGQGFILPSEVRLVLRTALGNREPGDHLVSVFQGFLIRRDMQKVTLDSFLELIPEVGRYIVADLEAERPEKMKSFREQTVKKPTNPYVEAQKAAEMERAIAQATVALQEMAAASAAASSSSSSSSSSAPFDASSTLGGSGDRRRILTAGAVGSDTQVHPTGLMAGAIRQAQLNGDATRRGLPEPIPRPGPPTASSLRLLGPEPLSTHDRDEGKFGSDPCKRPVFENDIRGFHTTTKELVVGTTRVSKHVPGYMGHVPKFAGGAAGAFCSWCFGFRVRMERCRMQTHPSSQLKLTPSLSFPPSPPRLPPRLISQSKAWARPSATASWTTPTSPRPTPHGCSGTEGTCPTSRRGRRQRRRSTSRGGRSRGRSTTCLRRPSRATGRPSPPTSRREADGLRHGG